jgi:hypothetical protein
LPRRRLLVALGVAVFMSFVLVNVGQVWALTITPSSPIEGQPFTISGTITTDGYVAIRDLSGCSGGVEFLQAITAPSYSVAVPGLPVGTYTVSASDDSSGCVSFTVIPAVTSTTTTVTTPIPEYPYGLALLAIFMILGYAVIKRRTRLS